ncbi:uncharacterized protein LOC128229674 isoform X2 [Mya arenaria]|uniref:uncharacterized protein LOC128229674 isoform X2 n=1 Tax=Mya arenaria TaxID=6604 RepID=UPI0022E852F0|nr:uncharacterized protein LOC128229674 isoform X2 [Mya arenaria]
MKFKHSWLEVMDENVEKTGKLISIQRGELVKMRRMKKLESEEKLGADVDDKRKALSFEEQLGLMEKNNSKKKMPHEKLKDIERSKGPGIQKINKVQKELLDESIQGKMLRRKRPGPKCSKSFDWTSEGKESFESNSPDKPSMETVMDHCMSRYYRLKSSNWSCDSKTALKLLRKKYNSLKLLFEKYPVIYVQRIKSEKKHNSIKKKEKNNNSLKRKERLIRESKPESIEDIVKGTNTTDVDKKPSIDSLVDPRVMSLSKALQSNNAGKVGIEKTFKQHTKGGKIKQEESKTLKQKKRTPLVSKPDWSKFKEKLKEANSRLVAKKKDGMVVEKNLSSFTFIQSSNQLFSAKVPQFRIPRKPPTIKTEDEKSENSDVKTNTIESKETVKEKITTNCWSQNKPSVKRSDDEEVSDIINTHNTSWKNRPRSTSLKDRPFEKFVLDGYTIEISRDSPLDAEMEDHDNFNQNGTDNNSSNYYENEFSDNDSESCSVNQSVKHDKGSDSYFDMLLSDDIDYETVDTTMSSGGEIIEQQRDMVLVEDVKGGILDFQELDIENIADVSSPYSITDSPIQVENDMFDPDYESDPDVGDSEQSSHEKGHEHLLDIGQCLSDIGLEQFKRMNDKESARTDHNAQVVDSVMENILLEIEGRDFSSEKESIASKVEDVLECIDKMVNMLVTQENKIDTSSNISTIECNDDALHKLNRESEKKKSLFVGDSDLDATSVERNVFDVFGETSGSTKAEGCEIPCQCSTKGHGTSYNGTKDTTVSLFKPFKIQRKSDSSLKLNVLSRDKTFLEQDNPEKRKSLNSNGHEFSRGKRKSADSSGQQEFSSDNRQSPDSSGHEFISDKRKSFDSSVQQELSSDNRQSPDNSGHELSSDKRISPDSSEHEFSSDKRKSPDSSGDEFSSDKRKSPDSSGDEFSSDKRKSPDSSGDEFSSDKKKSPDSSGDEFSSDKKKSPDNSGDELSCNKKTSPDGSGDEFSSLTTDIRKGKQTALASVLDEIFTNSVKQCHNFETSKVEDICETQGGEFKSPANGTDNEKEINEKEIDKGFVTISSETNSSADIDSNKHEKQSTVQECTEALKVEKEKHRSCKRETTLCSYDWLSSEESDARSDSMEHTEERLMQDFPNHNWLFNKYQLEISEPSHHDMPLGKPRRRRKKSRSSVKGGKIHQTSEKKCQNQSPRRLKSTGFDNRQNRQNISGYNQKLSGKAENEESMKECQLQRGVSLDESQAGKWKFATSGHQDETVCQNDTVYRRNSITSQPEDTTNLSFRKKSESEIKGKSFIESYNEFIQKGVMDERLNMPSDDVENIERTLISTKQASECSVDDNCHIGDELKQEHAHDIVNNDEHEVSWLNDHEDVPEKKEDSVKQWEQIATFMQGQTEEIATFIRGQSDNEDNDDGQAALDLSLVNNSSSTRADGMSTLEHPEETIMLKSGPQTIIPSVATDQKLSTDFDEVLSDSDLEDSRLEIDESANTSIESLVPSCSEMEEPGKMTAFSDVTLDPAVAANAVPSSTYTSTTTSSLTCREPTVCSGPESPITNRSGQSIDETETSPSLDVLPSCDSAYRLSEKQTDSLNTPCGEVTCITRTESLDSPKEVENKSLIAEMPGVEESDDINADLYTESDPLNISDISAASEVTGEVTDDLDHQREEAADEISIDEEKEVVEKTDKNILEVQKESDACRSEGGTNKNDPLDLCVAKSDGGNISFRPRARPPVQLVHPQVHKPILISMATLPSPIATISSSNSIETAAITEISRSAAITPAPRMAEPLQSGTLVNPPYQTIPVYAMDLTTVSNMGMVVPIQPLMHSSSTMLQQPLSQNIYLNQSAASQGLSQNRPNVPRIHHSTQGFSQSNFIRSVSTVVRPQNAASPTSANSQVFAERHPVHSSDQNIPSLQSSSSFTSHIVQNSVSPNETDSVTIHQESLKEVQSISVKPSIKGPPPLIKILKTPVVSISPQGKSISEPSQGITFSSNVKQCGFYSENRGQITAFEDMQVITRTQKSMSCNNTNDDNTMGIVDTKCSLQDKTYTNLEKKTIIPEHDSGSNDSVFEDDDDDIKKQMEELDREIKRREQEQEEMRKKREELLLKRKQAKAGVTVKTSVTTIETSTTRLAIAPICSQTLLTSQSCHEQPDAKVNHEKTDSPVSPIEKSIYTHQASETGGRRRSESEVDQEQSFDKKNEAMDLSQVLYQTVTKKSTSDEITIKEKNVPFHEKDFTNTTMSLKDNIEDKIHGVNTDKIVSTDVSDIRYISDISNINPFTFECEDKNDDLVVDLTKPGLVNDQLPDVLMKGKDVEAVSSECLNLTKNKSVSMNNDIQSGILKICTQTSEALPTVVSPRNMSSSMSSISVLPLSLSSSSQSSMPLDLASKSKSSILNENEMEVISSIHRTINVDKLNQPSVTANIDVIDLTSDNNEHFNNTTSRSSIGKKKDSMNAPCDSALFGHSLRNKSLKELQEEAIRQMQQRKNQMGIPVDSDSLTVEDLKKSPYGNNGLRKQSFCQDVQRLSGRKRSSEVMSHTKDQRTREIPEAHCPLSPPRNRPKNAKAEPAHIQVTDTRKLLKCLNKCSKCSVPPAIEQSCPLIRRKRECFLSPKEILQPNPKKWEQRQPKPAHSQRPFGIAGQLIVQTVKQTRKRTLSRDVQTSPNSYSLPNTPTSLDHSTSRRTTSASAELDSSYVVEQISPPYSGSHSDVNTSNSHREFVHSPIRAHRDFNEQLTRTGVLRPPGYVPSSNLPHMHQTNNSGGYNLSTKSQTDKNESSCDMEKAVQQELTVALAKRQKMDNAEIYPEKQVSHQMGAVATNERQIVRMHQNPAQAPGRAAVGSQHSTQEQSMRYQSRMDQSLQRVGQVRVEKTVPENRVVVNNTEREHGWQRRPGNRYEMPSAGHNVETFMGPQYNNQQVQQKQLLPSPNRYEQAMERDGRMVRRINAPVPREIDSSSNQTEVHNLLLQPHPMSRLQHPQQVNPQMVQNQYPKIQRLQDTTVSYQGQPNYGRQGMQLQQYQPSPASQMSQLRSQRPYMTGQPQLTDDQRLARMRQIRAQHIARNQGRSQAAPGQETSPTGPHLIPGQNQMGPDVTMETAGPTVDVASPPFAEAPTAPQISPITPPPYSPKECPAYDNNRHIHPQASIQANQSGLPVTSQYQHLQQVNQSGLPVSSRYQHLQQVNQSGLPVASQYLQQVNQPGLPITSQHLQQVNQPGLPVTSQHPQQVNQSSLPYQQQSGGPLMVSIPYPQQVAVSAGGMPAGNHQPFNQQYQQHNPHRPFQQQQQQQFQQQQQQPRPQFLPQNRFAANTQSPPGSVPQQMFVNYNDQRLLQRAPSQQMQQMASTRQQQQQFTGYKIPPQRMQQYSPQSNNSTPPSQYGGQIQLTVNSPQFVNTTYPGGNQRMPVPQMPAGHHNTATRFPGQRQIVPVPGQPQGHRFMTNNSQYIMPTPDSDVDYTDQAINNSRQRNLKREAPKRKYKKRKSKDQTKDSDNTERESPVMVDPCKAKEDSSDQTENKSSAITITDEENSIPEPDLTITSINAETDATTSKEASSCGEASEIKCSTSDDTTIQNSEEDLADQNQKEAKTCENVSTDLSETEKTLDKTETTESEVQSKSDLTVEVEEPEEKSKREELPHLQQIHGRCVLCGKYSLYLCSNCKKIWYCSPGCQLSHWQTHADECDGGSA